jgi:AraC-like DNA-binding protein
LETERVGFKNPLVLAFGSGARIESAQWSGFRAYRYGLQPEGRFGIAGEIEPAYALVWPLQGALVVGSGTDEVAEPAAPVFHRYRNALSVSALEAASGMVILIPQARLGRRIAGEPSRTIRFSEMSSVTKRLADCMRSLAARMDSGTDKITGPETTNLLLAELAEKLKGAQPSPAEPDSESEPWYVSKTERYLEERLTDSLTLRSITKALGVSARTLHNGFRRHRGYSPMRYWRELRMEAARKELVGGAENTSVTEVALKWGFCHLGRFSANYLNQYGELPSETLADARGMG